MKYKIPTLSFRELYASRHEPEVLKVLAHYYWVVLLTLLALGIVMSVVYGAWEFRRTDGAPPDTGVRPQTSLSKKDLQSILQGLETRVRMFEERRISPGTIKDPS